MCTATFYIFVVRFRPYQERIKQSLFSPDLIHLQIHFINLQLDLIYLQLNHSYIFVVRPYIFTTTSYIFALSFIYFRRLMAGGGGV